MLSTHIITKNNAPMMGGKLDLAPAVVFSMGMVVGTVAICGNSANQHFLSIFFKPLFILALVRPTAQLEGSHLAF